MNDLQHYDMEDGNEPQAISSSGSNSINERSSSLNELSSDASDQLHDFNHNVDDMGDMHMREVGGNRNDDPVEDIQNNSPMTNNNHAVTSVNSSNPDIRENRENRENREDRQSSSLLNHRSPPPILTSNGGTSNGAQNPFSFMSRDSGVSPNSAKNQPFSFIDSDSPYQNFSVPFSTSQKVQSNTGSHNGMKNFMKDSDSNFSHSNESSRSGMGALLDSAPTTLTTGKESKKRKRFTGDEDHRIIEAVNRRKNPGSNHIDWDGVAEDCGTLSRTKEQIRTRYYNIKNKIKDGIPQYKPSTTTSSISHSSSHLETMQSHFEKKQCESVGSASVSSISVSENFHPFGDHSEGSLSNYSDGAGSMPITSRSRKGRVIKRRTLAMQTDPANDYISQLQKELEDSKHVLREAIQTNKEQQRKIENQSEEFKQVQSEYISQVEKYPKALLEFLRKTAQYERQIAARKLHEDSERLGTIAARINGINVQEQWVAGEAFIDLQREQRELEEQKNFIEHKRKLILKLKMNIKKDLDIDDQLFELNEQDAVYRLRLSDIKKEEQLLQQRLKQLDIEKRSHIREIKRQRDESRSRFNSFPTIGPDGRYFLMKLIGRGGFSEVYQAYDLKELRIVACKIHQLNSSWKDSRKENYIKHVLRECQIHKKISHPRVVQMYDTFVYDENTYVTVLEFCSGYDLDMLLKKNAISEKKAQNIISQVFCGLKYLSEPPRKIIHFDLKPANILYCNGEIKITDFGLSKMMEEEDAIELTSQGAGTYWYLPPECFEVQKTPKISSKVDVWSAGVIFYQMLYGKKPFGNELSQREVLQQRIISNAKVVSFPSKPIVSQEAKEFIQLCLTYDQDERPDVEIMYRHKYLRNFSKSR